MDVQAKSFLHFSLEHGWARTHFRDHCGDSLLSSSLVTPASESASEQNIWGTYVEEKSSNRSLEAS